MGLRNLTFPAVTVKTSGGELAVRGLSFDDIFSLFVAHTSEVAEIFNLVVKESQQGQIDADKAALIVGQVVASAPQVVAEVIAVASGSNRNDPEEFVGDVGIAKALSLGEQMDALEKIIGQTFTSAMPPGKVLALVLKMMGLVPSAKS